MLPPAPARAETDELLLYTTYTIDRGRLALGLLSIDYGVLDGVSVGTDPPAWAARAFVPLWIPNLHVKWAFVREPGFRLAAQLGGYLGGLERPSDEARFFALPVSLFASAPFLERFEGHLETTFAYTQASGTGTPRDLTFEGAVASNLLQLGALVTYRATDVVQLTLRGRFQLYASPVVLRGDARVDEFTTAHVEAELNPGGLIRWFAVPGVAFLWSRVHLWLGLGYGHFFIPGLVYPLPETNLVPDGALYIIF